MFEAILENATRLCDAPLAILMMRRDDAYHLVAHAGTRPEFVEFLRANPAPLDPEATGIAKAAAQLRPTQTADVTETALYRQGQAHRTASADIEGIRSVLWVPMVKNDACLGVICVYRREVRPFDESQIDLVSTFADQAVIAIDNVRLFQALEARTDELGESLERQTATSEILRVISRSPTDYQPVFDAILDSAARLCDAPLALLTLREEDHFNLVAHKGSRPEYIEFRRANPVPIDEGKTVAAQAAIEGVPKQIADITDTEEYRDGLPHRVVAADIEGVRTVLFVPMMKNDECVGEIAVYRREVRPFDEGQIALLSTFADQAVIAIDNVHLFQELERRNTEITEALEQQTATTEVLKIISRSTFDLQPVLETLIENATRLCHAGWGVIHRFDGKVLRAVGSYGASPEFIEFWKQLEIGLDRGSALGRAALEKRTIHIEDVLAEPEYKYTDAQEKGGWRSVLAVPMIREGGLIGVMALARNEVLPFTDKQVELVSTFADQAAIAIENVRLFEELEARNRDLGEALERQTATSDILRVISRSPTDYGPVFDAILNSATRLCEAPLAVLLVREGKHYHLVAERGTRPEFVEWFKSNPIPVDAEESFSVRAATQGEPLQIPDFTDSEAYRDGVTHQVAGVELEGIRSALLVPMMKGDHCAGVIAVYRREVQLFEENHIALLSTFADQAVIAIDNVHLFQELERRNKEITEALEQQTATTEVLKIISRSTFDLQPVLESLIENAARLCGADKGGIFRADGDLYRVAATYGASPEFKEFIQQNPIRPGRESVTGRVALERRTIHVHDIMEDPEYSYADPRLVDQRTTLGVPMLRQGALVGIITIWKEGEVSPFTERQIDVVTTFADQAVIAIENVRLFQDLEARTHELSEALERQTATSDILRTISRSPTDYGPVFDAILNSATRLCEAPLAFLLIREGDYFKLVADKGSRQEYVEWLRSNPVPISEKHRLAARTALERAPQQIADTTESDEYREGMPHRVASVDIEGVRTALFVPMLKGDDCVGVIAAYRREVRPFSESHIALVSTFADQAVIAIDNVRLFQALEARTDELGESLERQTATSDILRTISRSPTDYGPVFDAILNSATRLCDAPLAFLLIREGDYFKLVADRGSRPEFVEWVRSNPVPISEKQTLAARAALERAPQQIADITESEGYREGMPHRVASADIEGIRTTLFVPMLKGDDCVGVIAVYRREVRPFSESHIALVSTFADQAVIAIDNVHLFQELQTRNKEITEALEQQTATSNVLQVISNSPTDVRPAFETIVDSASRLCDAEFSAVARLQSGELHLEALKNLSPEEMSAFESMFPRPPDRSIVMGRAFLEGRPVHIEDAFEDPEYDQRTLQVLQKVTGFRTILGVPLLRGRTSIGVILCARRRIKPFSEAEIELVKTFAAQAVIAIENQRLFHEVEARNKEITEALERQTATSDILRTISRSPTDYAPVFDAILDNATRLCDAPLAFLQMREEDHFNLVAHKGSRPEFIEWLRENPMPINEGNTLAAQVAIEGVPKQLPDITDSAGYRDGIPHRIAAADIEGVRTTLFVPMMRNDECIGEIAVYRREVRPFDESQIALVSTFADQAVIAIDNVRLFQALDERTRELARSVEELRALGEIGQVVNSTLDPETVLTTIINQAVALTGTDGGLISEYDEATGTLPARAAPGFEVVLEGADPVRFGEGAIGRAAETRTPIQIPDVDAPGAYTGRLRGLLERAGLKALLAVPLMREDRVLGSLLVARKTPGEFPPETVELLGTFAAQSALAIHNARLFREIEEKGRELAQANQHKSEFLANMSHELRTPLNAVIGFSEVLGKQMFGELNDKQKEYVNDIHNSGRHLLSLINDILDLSKIEAGRMELDLTTFDIRQALDNALTLVRERAGRRGIALDSEIDESLTNMTGDERKVKQILLNLLSNAIKFTPEGGRVTLTARGVDAALVISVRDTGVGISAEDQEHIFEEFRQVGTDYARKTEGTGLGLTLTRRFVELHGGEVEVESELGAGSEFRITLPLEPPVAVAAEAD